MSEVSGLASLLDKVSSDEGRTAHVQLSNELVNLLSEQLYQSPTKAIEELIVNAYDAGATVCKVFVPDPAEQLGDAGRGFIAVFDNGSGMNAAGLEALWRVGRSDKKNAGGVRQKRKLIGKFGIGKLAANAVGHRLTYVTAAEGTVRSVTVDFRRFISKEDGTSDRVELPLRRVRLDDWLENPGLHELLSSLRVAPGELRGPSWTIAIIEDLKPKAAEMRLGRLRWVISTALPLHVDFSVFLNGAPVESSKAQLQPIVEFDLADTPPSDLATLSKATDINWRIEDGRLVSADFPQGVRGHIIITRESLYGKKSDDIARSHGFFVRVHDRLINLLDPEFGLSPRSFTTFYSFRADVWVDDLQPLISSTREDIRESREKKTVQKVLLWIFQRASREHQAVIQEEEKVEQKGREHERDYVGPRLFEEPLADFLSATDQEGAEPTGGWFYLELPAAEVRGETVRSLLASPRGRYTFEYVSVGASARFVRFDASTGRFAINQDHDFAQEHAEGGRAQVLLEDVATAEVMLEVYLRKFGVAPIVIGEVLEARDKLLRSLAKDRRFSLRAISRTLRDAAGDERELEVALVAAARALGFVARHISYGDEPDGVARLTRYPGGDVTITLEAKSSVDVPSLGAIDFSGLRAHMDKYEADACLLVAPSYPGMKRGNDSQAAQRAEQTRVSCWTVKQLADVVDAVESRHITAAGILEVITTKFTPDDVAAGVQQLLDEPIAAYKDLYRAVLEVLSAHRDDVVDSERSIALIAGWVTAREDFRRTRMDMVASAVRHMSAASKGAMHLRDGSTAANSVVLIHTSLEELARRLEGLTGQPGLPRKRGRRRNGDDGTEDA